MPAQSPSASCQPALAYATLVLRKLLASSTFAIAGALTSISERLREKIKPRGQVESARRVVSKRIVEALDETAEEWSGDEPPSR